MLNRLTEEAYVEPTLHRLGGNEVAHAASTRTAMHEPHNGIRTLLLPSITVARVHEIANEIEAALVRSGYPFQRVHCQCDGHTLVLVGRTSRYFYIQVALTLALSLAGRRRVVSEIEVRPRTPVEPK